MSICSILANTGVCCSIVGHNLERRDYGHGWGVDDCIRCDYSVASCRFMFDETAMEGQ